MRISSSSLPQLTAHFSDGTRRVLCAGPLPEPRRAVCALLKTCNYRPTVSPLLAPIAPYNMLLLQSLPDKPTVSPLIIPLVYCHINGFQRSFRVEKPWPGGEK